MSRLVIALCLLCALLLPARSQDSAFEPPALMPPDGLAAYTRPPEAIANLIAVLELIKKARFGEGKLAKACEAEEFAALYRGMRLAHAGYYMFTAKQELGWPKHEAPVGLGHVPNRRIVQLGRSALLAWWKPADLAQLARAFETARTLPPAIKADLRAFVGKLRAFRKAARHLRTRAGAELQKLHRRQTDVYFSDYLFGWKDAERAKRFPDGKGLVPEEYSEALRALFNTVRDPDQIELHACLASGHAPPVRLGDGPALDVGDGLLLPVKYMVTFWIRRSTEGTEALADYLLAFGEKALAE